MTDSASTRRYRAVVPSNIALIKYWGKRDTASQWPQNDSLSMTLRDARTITCAQRAPDGLDRFALAGADPAQDSPAAARALRHVARLRELTGFAGGLRIESANTFPTAAGIASSASGMAALTVAALAAWTGSTTLTDLGLAGFPPERLAALARLGSGSACRSLMGGYVEWLAGASPAGQSVRQLLGPGGFDLADVIVVVDRNAKGTGSTAGHAAAMTSPLMAPRLAGLPDRHALVRKALLERNLATLGPALEDEALEMHAVMLSAEPPARYLGAKTAEILAWIRRQRRAGGFDAWFTLDAGPNIHLLCAPDDAESVAARIRSAFAGVEVRLDRTGAGPELTAEDLT